MKFSIQFSLNNISAEFEDEKDWMSRSRVIAKILIFLYGFLMVIPFSAKDAFSINWQDFTPSAWLSLGYIVVGTTFLAYLLTTFSLKALSAGVAGYYIYMQPVIAAAIGIFMFSEALSTVKIISAILIFAGVYLVNRPAGIKTNAGKE